MPRYFFDLLNAGVLSPDQEGFDITTLDEVHTEAACALADMLRDEVRVARGIPQARDLAIIVRDEHGPILQAKFSFEITRLQ